MIKLTSNRTCLNLIFSVSRTKTPLAFVNPGVVAFSNRKRRLSKAHLKSDRKTSCIGAAPVHVSFMSAKLRQPEVGPFQSPQETSQKSSGVMSTTTDSFAGTNSG